MTADHGKPLPFEKPKLARTTTENLMACPFRFARHGQSGIPVSELLPNLATCVDDLCVIRSMVADNINHPNACLQMFTGEQVFSRPSLGSWLLYGLGSESQDLPGFVAICPSGRRRGPLGLELPAGGLPGDPRRRPGAPDRQPGQWRDRRRRATATARPGQPAQRAAIAATARRTAGSARGSSRSSWRSACRCRPPRPSTSAAEPESVRRLYGLHQPHTEGFGRQCLIARRLVERGVRFVQLHTESNWDHHTGITTELPVVLRRHGPARSPGLLKDLKARGLLEDTLVIWGGEFGRSPVAQKGDGRDHHPYGFTMWLAGGGIKGGMVHGATDEFGWYAVEDKVHVHDLHATILHLMGIDHERLTYRYGGRDYRLTDVHGKVVEAIIA